MENMIDNNGNASNKDGQIKCPKCGATDISTNVNTGKLRCNFCRHEFDPELAFENEGDIENLEGVIISGGAQDIIPDTDDILTLKCQSCGAEVVIDTASAVQARCHWCRNTLSINEQIPNGAVPDAVLPFSIKKQVAQEEIEKFVHKRKFFAHPKFTKEFTTENICGVYFPYMVVDINAHANLKGIGEVEIRQYTEGSGDDKETFYDADLYRVGREFDIAINDLTIEASADKLNVNSKEKTTNIINAIMPFDTENCVKYNANYLKGYTSEKRDTDVADIQPIVERQAEDIARYAANDTLVKYDRGVDWQEEDYKMKGESWTATYLPVWLYSYMQKKGDKALLHYVAVNARTKETMGSVPINMSRLWIVSIIIEIFGGLLAFILGSDLVKFDSDYRWLLLLSGFAFFGVMYMRYRNAGARHTYEEETERTVSNMTAFDTFVEHRYHLKNSSLESANNMELRGNLNSMESDSILGKLKEKGLDLDDLKEKAERLNK